MTIIPEFMLTTAREVAVVIWAGHELVMAGASRKREPCINTRLFNPRPQDANEPRCRG